MIGTLQFCLLPLVLFLLASCGESAPPPQQLAGRVEEPPPLPAGKETVEFEAEADRSMAPGTADGVAGPDEEAERVYWGVEDGEPLPIMWEDLMPEGSVEELIRQQEEFYAMLEQRYAAEATSLRDARPFDQIEEGSNLDHMPQLGTFETVDELDGQLVRIPGYVVPFDFDLERKQAEFLFVPYMGACIHTPPPPPNQIIYVTADPAIRIDDIWSPYWLEGTLSTATKRNEVGDAAYTLTLDELEQYRNHRN